MQNLNTLTIILSEKNQLQNGLNFAHFNPKKPGGENLANKIYFFLVIMTIYTYSHTLNIISL